jgi:hypothetical protein
LVSSPGAWSGAPTSYGYLWQRSSNNGASWTNIGGATTYEYVPSTADLNALLRVQVTATNVAGSGTTTSAAVGPVVPATTSEQGLLGCGTYEVYVQPRGGGQMSSVIPTESNRVLFPWSQLGWSRVLDDTSQATVEADGTCGSPVGTVKPWKNEIALIRDGVQVWVGPVFTPTGNPNGQPDQLSINARDLTAWWDHRLIHEDHDYTDDPTDLAYILQAISDDAMAPDNSPGLFVTPSPCGILGTPQILAVQYQIAGQQIRTLSNSGVDWTCIARDVLCGGAVVPTAPITPTFTDEHFINIPTVTPDGSVQANSWIVTGSGNGVAGATIVGAAGPDVDAALEDGLLESVASDTTIQDNTTAQSAAQSRLLLTQAPVTVTGGILAATAPFPMSVLVPGATCYLNLTKTTIPVQGQFRLGGIQVNYTAGENQIEQVIPSFQPVGQTGAS